jgi:peptidoglycan hydrolase CwlO-like protein
MLMRMRLNSTIRLLAAFLCMLLIVPAVPVNISAKTIGEIQDEQAALQQETSELESQLASLQDDEAKAQEYNQTLSEQITHLQSKIDTTRKNINDLNDNITKLQKKLDESQLEYDTTMEQLKDRIKVLYQAGDVSTIEILLKSTSLYDFSMRTEMLKSMTSHDRQLMDKITDFMVKTKEDREALKKQKEEVAELQKSLESDQEDLIAAQAKNDEIIAGLQAHGVTTVEHLHHIRRGYSDLPGDLALLGAHIHTENTEGGASDDPTPQTQTQPPETAGQLCVSL